MSAEIQLSQALHTDHTLLISALDYPNALLLRFHADREMCFLLIGKPFNAELLGTLVFPPLNS